MACVKGAINMALRCHMKMVGVVSCAEGWRREKLSQSLKDGRTVTTMIIVFLFEAIVTTVLVLLLEVGVYVAVELINMIRDSINGD